ncbi:hypothetical protein MP228_008901 [Amoeboaphelidium protococcarum]|nr:hypothetical protein MP228_008901 [Amoeboaphelidium protococcarum]
MKVSAPNDVKIYTISSSSITALPDWLQKQKKKQLRNDVNFSQRVELIQDFDFPEAALRLKQSRDGEYIMATGLYKPQIRVFELSQMSMKFERHTDAENVQFEILSEDWRKMALLQADRTIEFHSPAGMHFRTRIPKYGRDMAYHYQSADLLVAASGHEVYRLNLEKGQFLNSLETQSIGVNTVMVNRANQLWFTGGEDGFVEVFDHRSRQAICRRDIGSLVAASYGSSVFPEITYLSHHNNGLDFAVGTKSGQVLTFDIRSSKPLIVKDHQYESPIKKIIYHDSGNIISADQKVVKIWDKQSGTAVTSIEAEDDINDLLVQNGLVMTANECPRMNVFFIPSIGHAPKWCSFLDNLTEELEETKQQQVWDDYKFVSRQELEHLGLDHMIGTNLLKAYMHGFFVDLRLYEKARAIANPFAYDDYKRRLTKEKLEEKSASRISAKRKLPKVNKEIASRLLKKSGEDGADNNPLGDSRFGSMFNDPDFQVDKQDPEYVKYNTTPKKNAKYNGEDSDNETDISGELEGVMFEEDDASDLGYEDSSSDDDDDDLNKSTQQKTNTSQNVATDRGVNNKAGKVKMYSNKTDLKVDDLLRGKVDRQIKMRRNMSFGDRIQSGGNRHQSYARNGSNQRRGGAMAMQFNVGKSSYSRDRNSSNNRATNSERPNSERRGTRNLNRVNKRR